MSSSSSAPIKYTLEHYRKSGVSEEAFLDWYHNTHLPLAVPLMKKHGITKFAVHVRSPQLGAVFKPSLENAFPTWVISEADLVLEYYLHDLSNLMSLVSDPDWSGKAVKGQEDWVDIARSTIHIGHETTHLDGDVINVDKK